MAQKGRPLQGPVSPSQGSPCAEAERPRDLFKNSSHQPSDAGCDCGRPAQDSMLEAKM
jgi:hypothetical protein